MAYAKYVLILSLAALSSCGIPYSEVHRSENGVQFHLNADYQVAYRIISEGMRGCEPPENISSVIYPDQKLANVTFSARGVTAWSVDIEDDKAGASKATFYSTFKAQKSKVPVFEAWVNEGLVGCWPSQLKKP